MKFLTLILGASLYCANAIKIERPQSHLRWVTPSRVQNV